MTKSMTIPARRGSKEYEDLRHRAAYVYATGWLPTHLRDHMHALLAKVTRYSHTPSAIDGSGGSLTVTKGRARALRLEEHPMVAKVRTYVDEGYTIQPRREPKARRPFGKVFLYRQSEDGDVIKRVTVQSDGSVLDHW